MVITADCNVGSRSVQMGISIVDTGLYAIGKVTTTVFHTESNDDGDLAS